MANRALLLAVHDDEPHHRMFLEWPYVVPLLHYLLVGFGTEAVPSDTYQGGLAIRGDGPPARAFVVRFLSWLERCAPEHAVACEHTRRVVLHARRQGRAYLLEAADVNAMTAPTAEGQNKLVASDAAAAPGLVATLSRLIDTPGSSPRDLGADDDWRLTDAFADRPCLGLITSADEVIATWD